MDRPEQTLVPPFVMVVQRGDDERYELLRKLFQSQRVDVVLDRRGGDRRSGDRRAAAGTGGNGHGAGVTRASGNGANGHGVDAANGTGANGQNGNGAGAEAGERRGGERRAVLPDTWVNLGFFVARRQLRS